MVTTAPRLPGERTYYTSVRSPTHPVLGHLPAARLSSLLQSIEIKPSRVVTWALSDGCHPRLPRKLIMPVTGQQLEYDRARRLLNDSAASGREVRCGEDTHRRLTMSGAKNNCVDVVHTLKHPGEQSNVALIYSSCSEGGSC